MLSRGVGVVALCGTIFFVVHLRQRSSKKNLAQASEQCLNDSLRLALASSGGVLCACYQKMLQETSLYLLSGLSCEPLLAHLLGDKDPLVVGFDVEWLYTGPSNRVDVLQLSVGKLNLVWAAHGTNQLPPTLRHILESRRILKVGVGIAEDARRVGACFGFKMHGCVELNDVHNRVDTLPSTAPFLSLRSLTQQVCDLDLPKDRALACSDWSSPLLSAEQVIYAACDAYCSLLVFEGIFHRYTQSRKKEVAWDYAGVRSLCPALIDGGRAQVKQRASQDQESSRSEQKEKRNSPAPVPLAPPPTKRLYENCKVFGPDGQLLALTNNKRVARYLKHGAGVLLDVAPGEPAAIKLFEVPETLLLQPESEELQQFYLSNLDNACVVCNATASFRRFHVIPHAFRRHFPNWYFSHRGHDSLLMCEPCHLQAEKHTEKLVKQIFEEHGLDDEQAAHKRRLQQRKTLTVVDADDQPEQVAAYNAARILLRARDKMPPSKREECMEVLRKCLQIEGEVPQADIEKAAAMFEPKPRGQATQYGVVVGRLVQAGTSGALLPAFCRRFREHFLQTMQPRHLPPHWTVDLPVALDITRPS